MKKNFKSLIASILAVAMVFTLAACGTPGTPGQSGPSGTPGKSGNEPAPAFVYVSSFREIDNAQGQGIGAACFTDKGFYTTPSEIVGQREPAEGEVAEYEGLGPKIRSVAVKLYCKYRIFLRNKDCGVTILWKNVSI